MTHINTPQKIGLTAYMLPAWQALRTYWPAILFIQGVALCVVLSYYFIEGSRGAFTQIANLKSELGFFFDRFYWLQNTVFGDGNNMSTLAIKMLADQLIFTPFVSLPLIVLWFMLHESKYSLRRFRNSCRPIPIRNRVLPLWASCLIFWPVMLCIVYSLPAPLQFPLFLLGNAAYSILMIFILRRQPPEPIGAPPPIDRDNQGS